MLFTNEKPSSWLLFIAIIGLAVANSMAWGSNPVDVVGQITVIPDQGCNSDLSHDPTIDELDSSIRSSGIEFLTSIDCDTDCTEYDETNEYWCRLRLPSEEHCSNIPFWGNNYNYLRMITWYECPNEVIYIRCSNWTYDGCWNTGSSDPPDCGGGTYLICPEI